MRFLLLLLLLGAAAAQSPGRLLGLEEHRQLSPAEVDAEVQGRFVNDGESPPVAVTGVSIHLIEFSSTAQDGGPATGVAQLYLPDEPSESTLLAFATGSTGLVDSCGPMQELLETGLGGTYGATALAFAGQGIPTVLPDYLQSLGPDGLQPYFVATAEAAVLIDALRAGNAALRQLDPAPGPVLNFLAGYSQGGHAVFAAADRAPTYAPDLPLGGVIGFGPSGDVSVLFQHFPYTAPWVVWSYRHTYPGSGLRAEEVLAPAWAGSLDEDVRRYCIAEAQARYPAATASLYTEAFNNALLGGTLAEDFPNWDEAFTGNETGLRLEGLPVLILQGVDDTVAPFPEQTEYVRKLCRLESPVRYANFVRTGHETRYVGFQPALDWMRSLLAGSPAPSDCPEVLP